MLVRFELRLNALEFILVHEAVISQRSFPPQHNGTLPAKINCATGSMLQLTNEFRVETRSFGGHGPQWRWSFGVIWGKHSRGSGRRFTAGFSALEQQHTCALLMQLQRAANACQPRSGNDHIPGSHILILSPDSLRKNHCAPCAIACRGVSPSLCTSLEKTTNRLGAGPM